jgi:hypothetical protein
VGEDTRKPVVVGFTAVGLVALCREGFVAVGLVAEVGRAVVGLLAAVAVAGLLLFDCAPATGRCTAGEAVAERANVRTIVVVAGFMRAAVVGPTVVGFTVAG